jgi:GNAT superfamily N-acetyltransferase
MTQPEITVRAATESDLGFVTQDGYLPNPVVRRKVGDGDVYVALRGDEPVGYLRLEWLWSKLPYIELIRVLEPHRRAGVGRALLAHVEAEAVSRGHAALYSSSQADEPEPQAWHRRRGFEECGLLAGLNEGGVGEVFFRKLLVPTNGAV